MIAIFIMPHDFVGEEFGQGPAAQLFCSVALAEATRWYSLADGLVWRVQDGAGWRAGSGL